MPCRQLAEASRAAGGLTGLQQALRDRAVPGGVQGGDLLNRRRAFRLQAQRERVRDHARPGYQAPPGGRAAGPDPGPGRDRYPDTGLAGLCLQLDGVLTGPGGVHDGQVTPVQVPVALHPGVDDPPVQA